MRFLATAIMIAMLSATAPAQDSTGPTITQPEWQAYRDAFVSAEGRVIDTANGNISHSEGQGYGLLLAYLANDRATFERIWSFTRTELMIRDDGLSAWMWSPDATPSVTDINNASDGDLLIAYALARAGEGWDDAEKLLQAGSIARTLAQSAIFEHDGASLISPGVIGFSAEDRPDGPVVNPSYWVFEAFPLLDRLVPNLGWAEVGAGGLDLIDRLTADGAIPADWMALAGDEAIPAEGFPPEFGYNNIRIPLYLMRAGHTGEILAQTAQIFDADFAPARIDVTTGERLEIMSEPGYRLMGAATACILEGTAIPADLATFAPTTYYAATLQLLTLDYLRREHRDCLPTPASPQGVAS
ncbi:glycosyl hydrolase family 8 [Pelagibacterium luteolum]|uniref:cellulase n=1 Tax=Pelagibacterium luteolum TaxID=440168 RepID=A0A1G7ZR53_9HYPH|nr:glycosyl hydrolase family 8 [Pelagibacterium luteolum]SDH11057.1 endoglucanase [Pelagibacterium luteolum]